MIILAYSLDHKGPFIYDVSHLGGRGGGVKPPLMKGSCTFRAHTRNEMPLNLRFNICKDSCTFRSLYIQKTDKTERAAFPVI